MNSELETSNWMDTFMSQVKDKDPETQWTLFKGKMRELRSQFVPHRTIKAGNEDANKGSFPIDKQVQQAINDKHTLHRRWRKGERSDSTPQREAYTKSQRKVKRLIRQTKHAFEKGLAERSKNNPKEMWKYDRSKLRTKTGVSPLLQNIGDPNSLKFEEKEKAEILQEQFCHVRTKENDGEIPIMDKNKQ